MRAALLFLAVSVASAQTGEDARSLLKSISNATRSADSLRVEGMSVLDTTGEQGTSHQEMSFELVTRGPLVMRYHHAGPLPGLQVCDGTSLWTYSEVPSSYVKGAATLEDCNPPFARWSASEARKAGLQGSVLVSLVVGAGLVPRPSEIAQSDTNVPHAIFLNDETRTTVNISLAPELGAFSRSRVKSGRYRTTSEVVRETLRLLQHQEKEREAGLKQLKAKLQRGAEQA